MAIAAASADGKDVFGKNGLFDELKKALAERMRMVPRLMSSGGFGHLSKNDFMLSRSTASVWPDEAGLSPVRPALDDAARTGCLLESRLRVTGRRTRCEHIFSALPDYRNFCVFSGRSALCQIRTFSLQHCAVDFDTLATVNAAFQTYTQSSR
jgi:hypothetical protein